MEFKKLEVQPERKGLSALLGSYHFRKSIITILIGAIAGFGYFYFSEGRDLEVIVFGDYMQTVLVGAFLGFFITNSPCARNKC